MCKLQKKKMCENETVNMHKDSCPQKEYLKRNALINKNNSIMHT